MTASRSIFATIIAVLIASASADEKTNGNFSSLTLRGHEGWVSCAVFSPNGKRIVSGGDDETLRVWDARSGKHLMTLRAGSAIASIAFSPNGQQIASGGWDKTVKVWDARSGKELLSLRGHTENVTSVAYSPNGRRIASGSGDDSWKVWDAASGKELLAVMLDDEYDVVSVAFSPDGSRLASGDGEGQVRIWDAANCDELLTVQGHAATVASTAFSPDGKQIASGSHDDVLKIWDARRGHERLTLRGHRDDVTSVAFSPNGNRIASGSDDDTVRIWDPQSGKELLTLRGHTDNVTSVAFSPDGKQIVSTSKNVVIVWRDEGETSKSTRGDREGLVGTWRITVFQDDGRDRLSRLGAGPARKKGDEPRVAKLVFTKKQCYLLRGDGRREVVAGLANAAWQSCKLDESAATKTIDIVGFAGKDGTKTKTYAGIYKTEADKLTICYCEQGSQRPTKFESDGAMNLFEAKRVSTKPLPLPAN